MNLDNNYNMTFGGGKRWVSLKARDKGNLMIEYILDKKVYVISRIDGKLFDGTEEVGAEFYGNMKEPETLDEIIEHEVNAFSSIQIEPEISMFNEFDWAFNEDKTQVIVYPVFLESEYKLIYLLLEIYSYLLALEKV